MFLFIEIILQDYIGEYDMGRLLNAVNQLHRRTARDYIGRMTDAKVEAMDVARRFDGDYWDGDRRYGYGGYKYDGRWETVARTLNDEYHLPADAKILDVGCGKAFLLHDFTKVIPGARVAGFDVSEHGLATAKDEVRDKLFVHDAAKPLPFADKEFDLVVSVNALHNLPIQDLVPALREIQRVGKRAYICVESHRNSEELFNLQCWALTCESFYRPDGWEYVFGLAGYTGDYEFIYFEAPEVK